MYYDENVSENNFYKKIRANEGLLNRIEEDCLICVPRCGTFGDIDQDHLYDHILLPCQPQINTKWVKEACEQDANSINLLEVNKKPNYTTLSNKSIRIYDETITQSDNKAVRILFEERHYIKERKLRILCIEAPLYCNTARPHLASHLQSFYDCIVYLQSLSLDEGLRQIRTMCKTHQFRLDSVQSQRELLGKLYSQCLRIGANIDDRFKLAVETCMQHYLQELPIVINTFACHDDGNFNRTRRKYEWITLEYLEISLPESIVKEVQSQLDNINTYQTVLEKIQCLSRIVNTLKSQSCDQLITQLSFFVIHSKVNNWMSNLMFLTQFQFAIADNKSYHAYLTTTLEATLHNINTMKETEVTPEPCSEVFQAILQNDLVLLKKLLQESKNHGMHCTCEGCVLNPPNIHLNAIGQSLLHVAALENRPDFIEFLSNYQPINIRDKKGQTALHYAAQYGHQDVALVLLVNSSAKVNVKDNLGNTPLHLASYFGWENCVKALLYSCRDLEVDSRNIEGRTALSFALESNYVDIATVLLENGACARATKSWTCNYVTGRLLETYERRQCVIPINLDYGIQARTDEEVKSCDLLLKSIRNGDFRLACYYLGFASESSSYNFRTKCHPLCNCERCYDSDECNSVKRLPINVNICNAAGFTALHVAAQHGRKDICRVLLDSKAKTNVRTFGHLQTPLHLACIYGKSGIVKALLECEDCLVDVVDCRGNTPLYYAEIVKDRKIVEMFAEIH